MIWTCVKCQHQIQINDSRLPSPPYKVKCQKCGQSFVVRESGAGDPPAKVEDLDQTVQRPGDSGELEPPHLPASREHLEQILESFVESKVEKMSRRIGDIFSHALAETTARLESGPDPLQQTNPRSVLLCEQDPLQQIQLIKDLEQVGFRVEMASHSDQLFEKLLSGMYPIVILSQEFQDEKMPADKALERINSQKPEQRRQVFVALLTKTLKTTRAYSSFLFGANLIINRADSSNVGRLLLEGQKEFGRIYKTHNETLAEL